jgi:glutamate--cysteine ligase
MRNFRRFSWLPVYLFGASPAVDDSFLQKPGHGLVPLDGRSHHLPHATSLRSGGVGYQSGTQSSAIHVCYNSLANYLDSLLAAITTPHPAYLAFEGGPQPRQIGTGILQYEAEFYTSMRAKSAPVPGSSLLAELRRGGVGYIEVRLLDVDPYAPLGITAEQMRLLDALLLTCLLLDSPCHGDELCDEVRDNMQRVVNSGRAPGFMLVDQGRSRSLSAWGGELIDLLVPAAEFLDGAAGGNEHQKSLGAARERLRDPGLTPSGRLLADLARHRQCFVDFALELAAGHRASFRRRPPTAEEIRRFEALALQSRAQQRALEEGDDLPFADYLERFRGQYLKLKQR